MGTSGDTGPHFACRPPRPAAEQTPQSSPGARSTLFTRCFTRSGAWQARVGVRGPPSARRSRRRWRSRQPSLPARPPPLQSAAAPLARSLCPRLRRRPAHSARAAQAELGGGRCCPHQRARRSQLARGTTAAGTGGQTACARLIWLWLVRRFAIHGIVLHAEQHVQARHGPLYPRLCGSLIMRAPRVCSSAAGLLRLGVLCARARPPCSPAPAARPGSGKVAAAARGRPRRVQRKWPPMQRGALQQRALHAAPADLGCLQTMPPVDSDRWKQVKDTSTRIHTPRGPGIRVALRR